MSNRVRTVDMSDPAVVLDCYRKLNVAYKELKAENEKLRAALKPFAEMITEIEDYWEDHYRVEACNGLIAGEIRAAAAALKETGDD